MTEICGQNRQGAFRILVRPIPRYQSVRCKSVPHVMQAWTVIIGDAAQTDLPGQCIKSSMDVSAVKTIALAGNEQIRGDRAAFPMTFAPRNVIGKYLAGRCVQRHEARLA